MIYAFGFTLLLVLLAVLFMRVDARRLAAGLHIAGPVALGTAGGALLLFGRAGLGGMLLSSALAWYGAGRMGRRSATPTPGRRSHVRTAVLEMELDHDTGTLDGMVLTGSFEGSRLSAMERDDLLLLRRELAGDDDSLRLLETYLDGRFPVWREDAKAHPTGGQAGAPTAGPMGKKEAYQILGLEAGAGPAEIRQAHRRLMQRLHPDLGGSSFLAARINEAKDVLLSDHG